MTISKIDGLVIVIREINKYVQSGALTEDQAKLVMDALAVPWLDDVIDALHEFARTYEELQGLGA